MGTIRRGREIVFVCVCVCVRALSLSLSVSVSLSLTHYSHTILSDTILSGHTY